MERFPVFFASAVDASGVPPYPDLERVSQLVVEGRANGIIYPEGALVPLYAPDAGLRDLEDAWRSVGIPTRSPALPGRDVALLVEAGKRLELCRASGDPLWAQYVPRHAAALGYMRHYGMTANALRESLRRLSRGFGGRGPWIAPLRGLVPVYPLGLFLPAGG